MVISKKKEGENPDDAITFGVVGETEDSILIGPVGDETEQDELEEGLSLWKDKEHDLKQKQERFWVFSSSNKPKYETPEELQAKIVEYFESGRRTRQVHDQRLQLYREIPVITISGLALYLGFASRQSFYDYESKTPDEGKTFPFSYTIKRARGFIEMEYEEMLQTGNHTAAIFALKQFNWKDTQTFEGEMTNNNNNKSVVVEYKQGKYEHLDENGEEK